MRAPVRMAGSTAKVTSQHGLCYARLADDFGEEHARIHAHENEKALALVAAVSERIGESAGFERRDAFVYAAREDEVQQLEQEAEAARKAGIEATVERVVPAPVEALAALRFPDQAQFDPFGYLQGIAELVAEDVQICEESRVTGVKATVDGARDNWHGPYPPTNLVRDDGRPLAEER